MSKLLEEVRSVMWVHHYEMKTEKTYVQWIRRFILFHKKQHPKEMGKLEVEQFLTWLAVARKVAPSTQNQALQAILYLYRKVLNMELAWLDHVVRAKSQRRVPVVLSRTEVAIRAGIINRHSYHHGVIFCMLIVKGLKVWSFFNTGRAFGAPNIQYHPFSAIKKRIECYRFPDEKTSSRAFAGMTLPLMKSGVSKRAGIPCRRGSDSTIPKIT